MDFAKLLAAVPDIGDKEAREMAIARLAHASGAADERARWRRVFPGLWESTPAANLAKWLADDAARNPCKGSPGECDHNGACMYACGKDTACVSGNDGAQ